MNISLQTRASVLLLAAFLASNTCALQAQAIQETVTDEKYANTTVVYKKGNANDAEILSQLRGSYGMGDVIRIAEAPPKPAPITVAPVGKLSTANQVKSVQVSATAVSSARMPVVAAVQSAPVKNQATAKAAPQAVKMVDYTPTYSPSKVNTLTASTDVMADLATTSAGQQPMQQVTSENWIDVVETSTVEAAQPKNTTVSQQTRTTKGASAVKSTRKSAKSGGWFDSSSARKKSTPTKKSRKHSGQRYGCFKF